MGTVFSCIADAALRSSDEGLCQHCERPDRTAYDYAGRIVDPALAADPSLAAEEPGIHVACAACIHGGNLCKSEHELSAISPVARAFADDPDQALRQYHQIPHIPLMMQAHDWVLCCGGWAEFVGTPATYDRCVEVPASHAFWNFGPQEASFGTGLRPESLREVCCFECASCAKKYFVWQPT